MILDENKLTKMVKVAMQEKAPKMYAELTADGTLNKVARERANAAMETLYQMENEATNQTATGPISHTFLERIQKHTELNNQATRTAIEQATEFPREDESDDETI